MVYWIYGESGIVKQKNIHRVHDSQAGFTLIELLTVISIITFLSTVIMVSFVTARKKGRDAKRMEDLKQMDTAIQFYINDKGHAPYLGAWNCSATNPSPGGMCYAVDSWSTSWQLLAQDLSPYIKKLPTDPCGSSCPGAQTIFRFQYEYEAPYLVASVWCPQITGTCTESPTNLNTMYLLSAQHLESTLAVWSFQRLTFAVSSFY